MKKLIVYSLFCLLSVGATKAQDMIFTMDYNFAQATGDLKEFIGTTAYRGGGLNFTKFLEGNENLGVGLSIDWQGFYEKIDRSTFPYYENNSTTSNTDINAVQFRYLYTAPITLSLDYYFVKDEAILPYIGINAGIQYTEQELSVGTQSNRINTAWDWAFGPEVGIHLPFGESGVGFNVIGRYNFATYDYTFTNIQLNTDLPQYISVGVGLSFLMEQ